MTDRSRFSLTDEESGIGDEQPDSDSEFDNILKGPKRIIVNESANQVKYFNSDAPPTEVSQCVVSRDGSVLLRLPEVAPLSVRMRNGLRKILRMRFKGKTVQQWLNKMSVVPYLMVLVLLGYVFFMIFYHGFVDPDKPQKPVEEPKPI